MRRARVSLLTRVLCQIYCPPGNCEVYTNPYGYVGAQSSFYKCYNPSTDVMTDGVWTGSLTNVTAPDDYIEPESCTAAEYSECDTDDDCSLAIDSRCNCYVSSYFHPFDPCNGGCNTDQCTGEECSELSSSCSPGVNGGGGTCQLDYNPSPTATPADATEQVPARCVYADECLLKIRSQSPRHPTTGVDLCGCYAESSVEPFDECEGDEQNCRTAKCNPDACIGLEAFCDISPDDNGFGECALRPSQVFEVM